MSRAALSSGVTIRFVVTGGSGLPWVLDSGQLPSPSSAPMASVLEGRD